MPRTSFTVGAPGTNSHQRARRAVSCRRVTVRLVISDVSVVPYGRPAGEALISVVADVKGAHPLTPVTVVVSSNFTGLSARRLLASGIAGGRGVVNAQFVTPFRLAELLSADLLHDRRP